MTINGYRRWLKTQIVALDDDSESAIDRADETVEIIREAEKIAIELGLPDIARHCTKVTTTMLALRPARLFLCECLAMVQKPARAVVSAANQPLTVPEVAKLLRVRPDKVLSWIRSGRLRGYNVAEREHGRPKYRISPEDLQAFTQQRAITQSVPKGRPVGRRRIPVIARPHL